MVGLIWKLPGLSCFVSSLELKGIKMRMSLEVVSGVVHHYLTNEGKDGLRSIALNASLLEGESDLENGIRRRKPFAFSYDVHNNLLRMLWLIVVINPLV